MENRGWTYRGGKAYTDENLVVGKILPLISLSEQHTFTYHVSCNVWIFWCTPTRIWFRYVKITADQELRIGNLHPSWKYLCSFIVLVYPLNL